MLSALLCPLPCNMRKRDILVGKKGNLFLYNMKKKKVQITHRSLWNSVPKGKFLNRNVLAKSARTNNESNYYSLSVFSILPQKHLLFYIFTKKILNNLGFRFGDGKKLLLILKSILFY